MKNKSKFSVNNFNLFWYIELYIELFGKRGHANGLTLIQNCIVITE